MKRATSTASSFTPRSRTPSRARRSSPAPHTTSAAAPKSGTGTIYPDGIESAGARTRKAQNSKSHQNGGGLRETLHLALLEPLRELFRHEVREQRLELALPREIVFRHPLPGPGLGVRILGEVK